MAALKMVRSVWVVTCDLCERTTLELDGDLDEAGLLEAMMAAGWRSPIYGGTFEPKCWAAMRKLNDRPKGN
ncbi:hypothetical protein PBI_LEMURIA_55 [Mycobacterium phage Lemuria]|uniref:Uncharacterized protein n=1 Tax=Mycobacterium phage Lemuria TaxID=2599868 RepID=A0A5J6THG8_9CAUD|nr:hypothetical protein KDW76_gp55 [Mycobacterium phage Lemuria]QFG10135.1 hypothetical protein PBI_LEMURIA_55 [Mycobacterium phage Lemuria]